MVNRLPLTRQSTAHFRAYRGDWRLLAGMSRVRLVQACAPSHFHGMVLRRINPSCQRRGGLADWQVHPKRARPPR